MAENETEYDIDVTNEVADAADIIGNAVRAQHDIDDDVVLGIQDVDANGDELAVTVTEMMQ